MTAAAKRPVIALLQGGLALVAVLLVVTACVASLDTSDDDSSTTVPAPAATDRAETVTSLGRAHTAQGICYGWFLWDGWLSRDDETQPISVGSNLGDSIPVDSDPQRCPRWVEVEVQVDYVSESSESNDTASVGVRSSEDLSITGFPAGLARFGLDEAAFIGDPGRAVCWAAALLPLLVTESGQADPVPVAPAAPSSSAQPTTALSDVGSDFWHNRWGYLVAGGGLLVMAVLMVTIGWLHRRQPPPTPAEAAATARAAAKRTEAQRQRSKRKRK